MHSIGFLCHQLNGAKGFTEGEVYQVDAKGRLIGDGGRVRMAPSYYRLS